MYHRSCLQQAVRGCDNPDNMCGNKWAAWKKTFFFSSKRWCSSPQQQHALQKCDMESTCVPVQVFCCAYKITGMSGDILPWLLHCLCVCVCVCVPVFAVHWLICMVTQFQGWGWAQWLSLAVTSHHSPVIETAEQRAAYEQRGDWRKSRCWMTHKCRRRSVPR